MDSLSATNEALIDGATAVKPMFSIITVVLNDWRGFMQTRESIAAQEEISFEWIVVDGGSRDSLVAYLEQGDPLITRWVSERDSGIYDAMNKGVSLAGGEFVVFMNAGDRFQDSTSLAAVRQVVEAESIAPDVVFGGAQVVFSNGLSFYRAPRRAERTIWHGLPANQQATYYRRDRLLARPYDLGFKICGDYYLVASLIRDGIKSVYVDKPLVQFRAGDTSHQSKARLLKEPYRIQRDILGQPGWLRVISFVRRLTATGAMMVMEALPRFRARKQSK